MEHDKNIKFAIRALKLGLQSGYKINDNTKQAIMTTHKLTAKQANKVLLAI